MIQQLFRWSIAACMLLWSLTAIDAQKTNWNSLIEEWRTDYNIPGMSVGIMHNGEIVLSQGFGVLEEGKPHQADQHTLYSIASNTKAFVSAALAMLVEEGALDWDDKVRKHLPHFQLYDPCVSDMITVRDLLCHRSGLGTFSGDVVWYKSKYSAPEVVRRAAEIPRAFEFRSGFGYSNMMYITAGEVIHAVAGKTWSDYVQEKFLTPLGMTRTLNSTSWLVATHNYATPHKPDEQGNVPIPWVNWDNMGAAGGMISSVDDMMKWMAMLLNKGISGQDTFLTRSQLTTMWTPHVNFPVSDVARERFGGRHFNGYGLAWSTTEYHGRQLVSHTGGYDGMYSAVMLLPGEKTGVVVLTNSMKSISTLLAYEIFDRLFGLPQQDWKTRGLQQNESGFAERAARIKEITDAREMDTQASLAAATIAGLYRCPMYGDIRIRATGDQLNIDFVSAPGLMATLTHWHHDTYRIEWKEPQAWFGFGVVEIEKDDAGTPTRLTFNVPNDDIFFEEIHALRVTP